MTLPSPLNRAALLSSPALATASQPCHTSPTRRFRSSPDPWRGKAFGGARRGEGGAVVAGKIEDEAAAEAEAVWQRCKGLLVKATAAALGTE